MVRWSFPIRCALRLPIKIRIRIKIKKRTYGAWT